MIASSSICGLNSSGSKEETRGEMFVFIIKKINAESTCHYGMISGVKCGVVWFSVELYIRQKPHRIKVGRLSNCPMTDMSELYHLCCVLMALLGTKVVHMPKVVNC